MNSKSISGSFTVAFVQDGISQPNYIQTQEAWSANTTSANATSMPADCSESSWADYTPTPVSGKPFLWRRSRQMTLNESTRQYVAGTWTYQRLSGENGTSISINGTLDYAYSTKSGFPPATQDLAGKTAVAKATNKIYKCDVPSPGYYDWLEQATQISDGDAYTVEAGNLNGNYQSTDNLHGHLIMWSAEASMWIDLGLFQGENGITYYTHIAWATGTTDPTQEHPAPSPASGQTSIPNKYAVTGFSIAPASDGSKPWMGIKIDQTVEDSTTANLYTWSKTSSNSVYVSLDNQNATMLYDGRGHLVSGNEICNATLYDGLTGHTTSGVTWSLGTVSNCYANINNNVITVSGLTGTSAFVIVNALYNGVNYSAKMTLKKMIDADKYDVIVTPNSVAYNATDDNPATTSITVECYKTDVSGTRALSAPPSGCYLMLVGVKANGNIERLAYTGSQNSLTNTCDNSEYKQYIACIINQETYSASAIFHDYQTISVNTAENGDDAVTYKISLAGSQFAADPDPNVSGGQLHINIHGTIYKTVGGTTTPFTNWAKTQLELCFIYDNGDDDYLDNEDFTKDGASFSTTIWDGLPWDGETVFRAVLVINGVVLASESIQVEKYGLNGTNGQRGKAGRFTYYAGTMAEVGGHTFTPDDYQAPYVNIGTDAAPNCKVYIGNNTPHTFPSTVQGYNNSADWESMTTDFKYLIAQAIFSEFAHFGSSIMNGDYLMSQYVIAFGFNGTKQAINDQTKYIYVEQDDMFAEDTFDDASIHPSYFPLVWQPISNYIEIDSTSYSSEEGDFIQLDAPMNWGGGMYTIQIEYFSDSGGVDWKISEQTNTPAIAEEQLPEAYYASGSYVFYTHSSFITLANPSESTSLKMFFKLPRTRTSIGAVIKSVVIRQVKFTPVNCQDMLRGKIAINDLVARGQLHAESFFYEVRSAGGNNSVVVINQETIVNLSKNSQGSVVVLPTPSESVAGRVIEISCAQDYRDQNGNKPSWRLSFCGMTPNDCFTSPLTSSGKVFVTQQGYSEYWSGGSYWMTTAYSINLNNITYVKLVCVRDGNGKYHWSVIKGERTYVVNLHPVDLGGTTTMPISVVENIFVSDSYVP